MTRNHCANDTYETVKNMCRIHNTSRLKRSLITITGIQIFRILSKQFYYPSGKIICTIIKGFIPWRERERGGGWW